MVKEIITDIDSLRYRAEEADLIKDGKRIREIVLDLKDTIREKNLMYLTAPQIGENVRLFCINFSGDIHSFVNPIVANSKTLQMAEETCNSIEGKRFLIPRANEVIGVYETPMCDVQTRKFSGLSAFVYQHCVAHLDGILVSDIGLEIDGLYDNATEEEKGELISRYIDALGIKQKELEKEITTDPDLKEMNDAVKFAEAVSTGEVEIEGIRKENNEEDGNKD